MTSTPETPASRPLPLQWVSDLALILLLSLLVRQLFVNGSFGSDDLVYFARAAQIARGEWSSADYNGALRYGFNVPAACFIALFGENLIAANLWPLACSLIEIGAVYLYASAAMDRRAGIFAALLLAAAPLHTAVATRIHADPVVSMFLTLSFVLLYFGTWRRQPTLLFAAGLSIGGVFWAKELAAVTWFAFLPMLWFFRGQWRNLIPVAAGTAAMLLLHGALMYFVAGDALHAIRVVLAALKRSHIDGGKSDDSALYYLRYLFVDARHVGLIAFFAAAAVWIVPRRMRPSDHQQTGLLFAVLWWLALLAVLSAFPVSLSPLRLTMKQSNYITLFLAPMAVLAGMTIAVLPRLIGRAALALCITVGLLLGALEQADYRVFVANSKALAVFAAEHPQAMIVGSTNNEHVSNFLLELNHPEQEHATVVNFRALGDSGSPYRRQQREAGEIFAVLDRQTMSWFAGGAPITEPLACWQYEQTLEPADLGLGNELAALARGLLSSVAPAANALSRLASPQRADIYRVIGHDVLCGS